MAFNKFKSAAAKPEPKAEPKVEPAPKVEATEAEVLSPETIDAPPPPRGLAKMSGLKTNVLALVAQESEQSNFSELFPHICIKGGNAGGTLIPTPSTERTFADICRRLPQGKQPCEGIVMGFRAEAIAWPRNYDDRKEGEKPSINCAISFVDQEGISTLVQGCKNFQFAKKEVKNSKWELANGGPGHLRPTFQMLMWLPDIGQCVVLQSSPLLETFQAMAKQVMKLANPDTQELDPIPVVCSVTTEPWYEDNSFHYWQMDAWRDARAKAAYEKFAAWVADVQANRPDIVEAVSAWVNGTDKEISETDGERLTQAANMVNPRSRAAAK
jgi:hypothetical protein